MKILFGELLGLFVEDGAFAVAILAWLGVAWFVLPRVALPPVIQGPVLVAGLLAILLQSVVRAASRKECPGGART